MKNITCHKPHFTSDTIGSITKSTLKRGMFKKDNIEIRDVDVVVHIIRSEVKEQTKKIDFFVIEKIDPFERILDRDSLEISGISRVHSLVAKDNKLYLHELSCNKCTVNEVCEECLADEGATQEDIIKGNEFNDEETDDVFHDDDDDGQSDASSDDDDSEDDESVTSGGIVWAKHVRIWYPAKVCAAGEVPETVLSKLGRSLGGKVIVKAYSQNLVPRHLHIKKFIALLPTFSNPTIIIRFRFLLKLRFWEYITWPMSEGGKYPKKIGNIAKFGQF